MLPASWYSWYSADAGTVVASDKNRKAKNRAALYGGFRTSAVNGKNAGGKAEWPLPHPAAGFIFLSAAQRWSVFLIDGKVNYCKVPNSPSRFS